MSVRSFHEPGHPFDVGLPAELPFGADLFGDARDLGGEGVELIDHLVDDVFHLEDLPLDVDGDLSCQVAIGDGRRDLGYVAELHCEIGRHRVDVVGQVFPGTGDAFDVGLPAELSLGADLLRDARNFGREGTERVHHRIDGVLELIDLASRVDGDLSGRGLRLRRQL